MRFLVCAFLVSAASFCSAETVTMSISLNGSAVGQNIYDLAPDGKFSSKTVLNVGSTKISSDISGLMKGNQLLSYECTSNNAGVSLKMSYADGKLTVDNKGKKTVLPYVLGTTSLSGSLHPQFMGSLLNAARTEFAKPKSPALVKVKTYMVDGGQELVANVTRLPEKKLFIKGAWQLLQQFQVSIGALDISYYQSSDGSIAGMNVPTQKLRFVRSGYEDLYVDPMAKYPELSQPTHKTKTLSNVRVKTRDGAELACEIARPVEEGKYPTILVRTPYGRGGVMGEAEFFASRGYVFISQDCRGREDSTGEWDPFVHERKDGADTINWITQQPWSDGKVGMIGGSYVGYVQWAAAVEKPAGLKCIIPQVSPPDAMTNLPYDHGVFLLYSDLWWSKIVSGKRMDLSNMKGGLPHMDKFATLPLSKVDDAVLGANVPFFDLWLKRTTIQDWKGFDTLGDLKNVTIPALHISGWWDGDGIGTKLNWAKMREMGRKNQWLIYGPWVHAFNTTSRLGDVDYGKDAIIELDSLYIRWFDTWLKGKNVGLEKVPHVRAFVTGANKWVTLDDWPGKQTKTKTLYFAMKSNKKVLTEKLGNYPSLKYTYDPAKDTKVPTELLKQDETKATTKVGNISKKEIAEKLFIGDVLKKDTAITGPIKVTFHFTTSAKDTDLFASFVDIAPNGDVRVIGASGKQRGSYLGGYDKVRPLVPGKVYTAVVEPWDTAHEFKKGHRFGVLFSSSEFPMCARNLGTAEPIFSATKMLIQKNTILMDKVHASKVQFQVLWEK